MTVEHFSPTSARLAAAVTRLLSAVTEASASGLRSKARTEILAFARLRTIGAPILPTPTKPIVSLIFESSLSPLSGFEEKYGIGTPTQTD